MTKTDSPLKDQLVTALERNPYLKGRSLRFETEQGRVTLRGVVHSYYQKQMAQEAVRHLDGVDEICNELEVNWAWVPPAPDCQPHASRGCARNPAANGSYR